MGEVENASGNTNIGKTMFAYIFVFINRVIFTLLYTENQAYKLIWLLPGYFVSTRCFTEFLIE